MSQPRASSSKRTSGFALISGLLMLLVVTVLALSMFRSFGLQEKIGGNAREKQRAFQAAESSAQLAEWWLGLGNWSTGVTCNGLTTMTSTTQMLVCSNKITTPQTVPWATRIDNQLGAFTVNTAGAANAYQAVPGLYISYLGQSPVVGTTPAKMIFQINAFGYGGSAQGAASAAGVPSSTVSVVQSVYAISPSNIKAVDGG